MASPEPRAGVLHLPSQSPDDTLAERLVQTALALVAEAGPETLSLRRIARAAGVSHSAPLRHFRSYADLLAEVAAQGFALLSGSIERSADATLAGDDPLDQLEASARAYIGTAVANPGLFALMFRPGDLDITNTAFVRESRTAFEHVVRRVSAAQDAGWHPQRETRVLAAATWAAVHGLATLWSQGALLGPVPGASLEDAITNTLELVLGDRHGGNA
jgi:AcrR family transcriptional regulator